MGLSIVTVCLNSEKTIERMLKSLYKDNNVEFEHIVVDGFSTDNTLSIVKEYADERTKIFQLEPKGIYNAMNFGAVQCSNNHLLFLNSDDYLNKDCLVNVLPELGDCDLVYGNVCYVYPDGSRRYVFREASLSRIKRGDMPQHQGTFVKQKWLLKYPFDESLKVCGDYDFFCNFLKEKVSSCYLGDTVSFVSIGGASSNLSRTWKEQEQVIGKHFGFYFWFQIKLKHLVFGLVKKVSNKFGLNLHK